MSRGQMSPAVTAAVLALVLSGCGLAMPVPGTGATAQTTPAAGTATRSSGAPALTDNEVPTPPGPAEHAPGAGSAVGAVRTFAIGYINWTAADLRSRLSRLAADSVGQARSAMELAAQQTGSDPELTQAGVANHGRVEAVSALTGGAGRYVVVTLESTTATDSSDYEGLAPAWHLAVATVAHRGGRWVVSGWQPKS
jgi:hypothetical protein